MGDHFQTIVDLDAGPDEAATYAERGLAWLISEGIVSAERTDCVLGAPLGHPPGPNSRSAPVPRRTRSGSRPTGWTWRSDAPSSTAVRASPRR
ncbi:hypothetical protein STENM223S_02905 [Streptomyces tendae]